MRKLTTMAAILALALAACARTSDNLPTVRAGGDADNPARARDAGRAAGAGGSHAPGSTGLGSGTMGVESSARQGSAR